LTERPPFLPFTNLKGTLTSLFPKSDFDLILVDLDEKERLIHKKDVLDLIHPLDSEMDFNISMVLKFGAIGKGISYQEGIPVTAQAKVLFSGLGADEYFGGYSRYKSAFTRGGYSEMNQEMSLDQNRLWVRNLGRDDRVISSEGKELRTPFLSKNLVEFVKNINLKFLASFSNNKNDINQWKDKKLLRKLAKRINFHQSSTFKKKAIQFGSGLAKESNLKTHGVYGKGKGHLKVKN